MIQHNLSFVMNGKLKRMMKKEQTLDWAFRHGMYAYEAKTPFEYLQKLNNYQIVDVGSQIMQDVLVIGARKDHFIATELYKQELDALTNVRSLTFRLFTEQESGENHCNCGNSKLCFDTMMSWIDQMKKRDRDNES